MQAATSAPLIERSIERATGIVYNITGGRDLTLQEVNRVSEVVTGLADPSANVIFGAVIDEQYDGEIHVTIIATGFSQTFEENLLQGKAVVSMHSYTCTCTCLHSCLLGFQSHATPTSPQSPDQLLSWVNTTRGTLALMNSFS